MIKLSSYHSHTFSDFFQSEKVNAVLSINSHTLYFQIRNGGLGGTVKLRAGRISKGQ